jgi:uncharacterized membrane-anchored protein
VIVGLIAMILALGPPLWVRATGSEVTLPIRPVDPFSIFRGNYLDLRYDVTVPGGTAEFEGEAVYAVFADERPGRLLRITDRRPDVGDDEFCIRARARYGELEFPNLEQFYVSSERAAEIEQNIRDYLAVLDVTTSCRAILVDLEPR